MPSTVKELRSNPETREDIERYIRSTGVASRDRIKLMKLAWEMIGTEFAGRHQQYELFYAGSRHIVAKNYSYMNYGFKEAVELVDACLGGYE